MTGNRPSETAKILTRSVCLTLECHYLGNVRKVATSSVIDAADGEKEKVDGEQVRSTKRLVDVKALRPCMRILQFTQNYLRDKAIPALGPLYNEKEYPTKAEVMSRYDMIWRYVSFAAPELLESVDEVLYEEARDNFENQMAEAFDEVKLTLRATLSELVGDLVKKITPTADGEVKIFRNSVLDGLAEYLSTFNVRNITDDDDLKKVVDQLRNLTKGIDPQTIRDDETLRANVTAKLAEASAQLDGLVKTQRRSFRFGAAA